MYIVVLIGGYLLDFDVQMYVKPLITVPKYTQYGCVHTYIHFRLPDFRPGAEQAWKKLTQTAESKRFFVVLTAWVFAFFPIFLDEEKSGGL